MINVPRGVGASTSTAATPRTSGLRKLRGRVVGSAPATTLEAAEYELPDGRRKKYAIVHRPMAAGVIAVRSSVHGAPEVLLVQQPRAAVEDARVLEIVAGKMDEPGEVDPRLTAQRELAEEAGVRAGVWRLLGANLYPSPGYTDERVHIYAAWDLTAVAKRAEDSHISNLWVDLDEAVSWVASGAIRDGKTRDAIWSVNHVRGTLALR